MRAISTISTNHTFFQIFDQLLKIILSLEELHTDEDGPAFVFQCRTGKGRTTTAMAIAGLIICHKKVTKDNATLDWNMAGSHISDSTIGVSKINLCNYTLHRKKVTFSKVLCPGDPVSGSLTLGPAQ